jgi:hypothetical protein
MKAEIFAIKTIQIPTFQLKKKKSFKKFNIQHKTGNLDYSIKNTMIFRSKNSIADET